MRKVFIIVFIACVIFISGFLLIKFSVLKTHTVKADNTKAISATDLRPSIIAKLQELVKDGSNGLYKLSIERIEPFVFQSKLDAYNVMITPDSNALLKLQDLKLAPDDLFKITFDSLHIDGIGIEDLLQKKKININAVYIKKPSIEMFHTNRPYNKNKRVQAENSTLYQGLMKRMQRIRIDKIIIKEGTFTNRNLAQKNKITRFNNVSIHIKDMLIDSSTQFSKDRFLFARSALISTTDYSFRTPDSLYFFKIGTISVLGEQHKLIAENIHLQPRGNREQFIKKLHYQNERYDLKAPKITLDEVDLYSLVNGKKLFSEKADIYSPDLDIFFDRSLPVPPTLDMQNFPSQLIMSLAIPVSVKRIGIHHFNLVYGEFNPVVSKNGTVYFDNINCTVTNLTNIPAEIHQNKFLTFKGDALFMHQVPTDITIRFDMAQYKKGVFAADIKMGKLDSTIVNRISAPLGEFTVKTGVMDIGEAHVAGDNYNAHTRIRILYHDLRLTPLKNDEDKPGGLKKKTITGIIANTFLIKNNNPSKGEEARIAEVPHKRKLHTSFFSLIWKTILTGILKTIGLSLKIADK